VTAYLVVSILPIGVVGHVTYTLELRDPLQKRFFDTFLQRNVGLATALAAATELQYRYTLLNHIDQRDLAPMAGEPRVDLGR
jgi:hypothetical protein